jgi:WD40 repeat protein
MSQLNPDKPTLLYQLLFQGAWPTSVAFLGSSQKLAAANREGQIYIWGLPEKTEGEPADKEFSGKDREKLNVPPMRRLEGHTNGVTRLAASADGKFLFSSSLDHSVRIWETDAAASGKGQAVMDAESREEEFKRSRKKEVLEAPGAEVEVQTACHVLSRHEDWVNTLALSRDGSRLISGDGKSLAIVWDVAGRKEIARLSGHPWNWIVAAALSPDGKTALLSEYRYKRDDFDIPAAGLKLFAVDDGSLKLDLLKVQFPKLDPADTSYGGAQGWRKFVAGGLVAADFSPDGKLLALGQGGETDTGKVHIIESESGKLLRTISSHQYGVCDVRFTADGKYLLSCGRDTTLRICQVEDGKELAVLGKPRGGQFKDWLAALALSPDETHMAAVDIGGIVSVWRL